MDNWLTTYLEAALSRCEARYLVLTDTNGIELSHAGSTSVNLQVLAPIFQNAVETTSKLPTGPCKSVMTRFADCLLILRNFGSLYVVLVAQATANLGKVYAVLDRMKSDLEPLIRGIDRAEELSGGGNISMPGEGYQGMSSGQTDAKKRAAKPAGATGQAYGRITA
mmetsp:Transcript_22508/g.40551  ORF Transcript_22508/g.40551 Transcript_22508/m.40551 type:complete len:166 (+) Transcript_22508:1412-1909(+)